MADTTFIKKSIEPYVREWLASHFSNRTFAERPVELVTGGVHKFDAVSRDTSVVANILSSRPTTRTGKVNTGAVRKALNDVQYLQLLPQGVASVSSFSPMRDSVN